MIDMLRVIPSKKRILDLLFFNGIATLALTRAVTSLDAAEVDFSRDVLPILANKCFVCHGPDDHPETDLKLDNLNAASEDRGGYQAINQEHPEQSELLKRILDTADPMPPMEAEKQLSESERETLVRWVKQGGDYESHWAWISPLKSQPFDDATNAIDTMITTKLEERGFELAAQATPEQIARRASLTLTGLPPEPQWLSEFLEDPSAAAYDRFVDQLLASPRYGEHQARYWLDAVRYGDTHGLHLDNRRGIYPYRDWVVRALNENLPLDDFITWQLAGDLLNEPTMEQRLATGFIRMNPSTGEGGAIAEEFQMKNNFDRVETFGTIFLGLSLTCARCHTHKYDPIKQTEYYELLSFFNNTNEPPLDGNSYTYGSTIAVPADQPAWQRWKELQNQTSTLLREHTSKLTGTTLKDYADATGQLKISQWQGSTPHTILEVDAGQQVDSGKPDASAKTATLQDITGFPGTITSKQDAKRLPAAGQTTEISVTMESTISQTADITFSGGDKSTLSVTSLDAANSEASDGRSDAPTNAEVVATKIGNEGLTTTRLRLPKGRHHLTFSIRGYEGLESLTLEMNNPWQSLATKSSFQDCDSLDQLKMLGDPNGPFHRKLDAETSSSLESQTTELVNRITSERSAFTTSLVAIEQPNPRVTRLLRRGEYDLPEGDPLTPSTPAVLGGWSPDLPANRLGLAQWVTAKNNPLVARVLVNRIWQRVFGSGLVRTPEDFGVQGEQPTHPELLDWLAVELIDSGWDLKAMLKAMVTTRTFRQSSQWRDAIDDPENRLLGRASSYRLDAEVLRDLGLWASGSLATTMGGEGIKPYQPDGMWAALAHPASNTKSYQRDTGERLNRRSLYVYWKRTSPHPMMTLFDAPDRESSCVRRSRTNTPLQSLGMLNEVQRIEIGRAFASQLLSQPGSDAERIEKMFAGITCRQPSPAEQTACLNLLTQMRERYQASPADAKELLSVGEASHRKDLQEEELAAWSILTTTFLASDTVIMLY